MEKSQLAFLVDNMMEMEIELRAHSILLDALVEKVITLEEVPENLQLARQAPSMLAYVGEKYRLFSKVQPGTVDDGEPIVSRLARTMPNRDYTH